MIELLLLACLTGIVLGVTLVQALHDKGLRRMLTANLAGSGYLTAVGLALGGYGLLAFLVAVVSLGLSALELWWSEHEYQRMEADPYTQALRRLRQLRKEAERKESDPN